jgi:hypothetical protein
MKFVQLMEMRTKNVDEIQKLEDEWEKATEGKRTLRAPALPGDLVYVPIDANRGEFWARLRDITGSLFGGLVGAATIKGLAD